MRILSATLTAAAILATLSPHEAKADETGGSGSRLGIEVNAATDTEAGCTLSFLAQNATGTPISSAILEAVLFDTAGQVSRLTLFDFGALPAGRLRVRQFAIAGQSCDSIGRVLINGVESCSGGALDAAACEAALDVTSRTTIEVAG